MSTRSAPSGSCLAADDSCFSAAPGVRVEPAIPERTAPTTRSAWEHPAGTAGLDAAAGAGDAALWPAAVPPQPARVRMATASTAVRLLMGTFLSAGRARSYLPQV